MEPSQLSSVFTFDSATLTQEIETDRVRVIWGTNINVNETAEQFRGYLRTQQISTHIAAQTNIFQLNCQSLPPLLRQQLLMYPIDTLPILEATLNETFQEQKPDYPAVKMKICGVECKLSLDNIDISLLDHLVEVTGTVVRVAPVEAELSKAIYRCAHCAAVSPLPDHCAQCNTRYAMSVDPILSTYIDKQQLKVQDPSNSTLLLQAYEVDSAVPGDTVIAVGILRPRARKFNKNTYKSRFDIFLEVVSLFVDKIGNEKGFNETAAKNETCRVLNQSDLDLLFYENLIMQIRASENAYQHLVSLVAPFVCGMDDVKKSVLLQLLGGVEKKRGKMRMRGTINILLAGDPGTCKSRILSFVHSMARGIYTSGTGSSAVGLTAAVIKEENNFVLSPGALVLSDGGVCCIDEFDKMDIEIKAVLHEVMEQQTISISKAGIITSLNCRCSILACCNPVQSTYNPKKTIVENINVVPSLLSRFDVVCLILDKHEEENDRKIAEHIFGIGGINEERSTSDELNETLAILSEEQKNILLKRYIEEGKKIVPRICNEASKQLSDAYVRLRQLDNGKSITATTRQLESLIRLSEALARCRLSETVSVDDVIEAERLIKDSLLLYAVDPLTGKIDMDLILTGKSTFKTRVDEVLKTEVKNLIIVRANILEIIEKTGVEKKKIVGILKELVEDGFVWFDENTGFVEKI